MKTNLVAIVAVACVLAVQVVHAQSIDPPLPQDYRSVPANAQRASTNSMPKQVLASDEAAPPGSQGFPVGAMLGQVLASDAPLPRVSQGYPVRALPMQALVSDGDNSSGPGSMPSRAVAFEMQPGAKCQSNCSGSCQSNSCGSSQANACGGCQSNGCGRCNGNGAAACGCGQCRCTNCKCPEKAAPCDPCPRVNNLNPAWNLSIGGVLEVDALYNTARPVAPGTPFFLAPRGPFEDDTFDIHGRSSTFYLAARGPQIGEFQAGGLVVFCLYNDNIIADRYGFLPFQAYGELKNEDWRFAGGLQMDIFAPVIPTVLPFSILAATGNTGLFRGQFRAERFIHLDDNQQITITSGISDANPTIFNNDVLTEDNGWPNVEVRTAWGAGPMKQDGLVARRPFEVGASGVIGQIRSTDLGPLNRVVANVNGFAGDLRWRINEKWGVQGELYTGQGLGTYGGGVLQSVNSTTFDAIRTNGFWGEVYHYWTPCLHSHVGYGVDDPIDRDLAATQIAENKTGFGNLIWDVTPSFRVATELTYRKTSYVTLPDNDGMGVQWQMQWKL